MSKRSRKELGDISKYTGGIKAPNVDWEDILYGNQRQPHRRRTSTVEVMQAPINRPSKNLAKGELKYYDENGSGSIAFNTWTGSELDPAGTLCLFAPIQGSGDSERDGRQAIIKSIHVNGRIYRNNVTGISNAAVVHMILVQDTQTNGAQLNGEDVYMDSGNREFQYRNMDHSSRFKVLWSKRLVLNPEAIGYNTTVPQWETANASRLFEINKNNLNIPVSFNGNAGTIADITDNSIHLIATSNSSSADVIYQSRVKFIG